jgi:hypothetical protein
LVPLALFLNSLFIASLLLFPLKGVTPLSSLVEGWFFFKSSEGAFPSFNFAKAGFTTLDESLNIQRTPKRILREIKSMSLIHNTPIISANISGIGVYRPNCPRPPRRGSSRVQDPKAIFCGISKKHKRQAGTLATKKPRIGGEIPP